MFLSILIIKTLELQNMICSLILIDKPPVFFQYALRPKAEADSSY